MYKNRSDSDPIVNIRGTSGSEKEKEKNTASDLELNRMWEIGSGKYDPARFRLLAGRNDHNWPKPKRLRAGSGMFTGVIHYHTQKAVPTSKRQLYQFDRGLGERARHAWAILLHPTS